MVKAIARAFHWREMQESGTHTIIAEIAAAEKINEMEHILWQATSHQPTRSLWAAGCQAGTVMLLTAQ
jgi:hypothetical protein